MSESVMARMNIRDLRIAFITKEGSEGIEYEAPILIPGAMEVGLSPRVSEAPLYGDGRLRHKVKKIDGYDVTLGHNKIPPAISARMQGKSLEGKIRVSRTVDSTSGFALGFVVDQFDGHTENTWLPKCVAAPSERTVQQSTGSVEYSTDSLSITSMALQYNDAYEYTGDTADEESGFSKEDAKTFFDKVPVMPKQPPAVEPDDVGESQIVEIE